MRFLLGIVLSAVLATSATLGEPRVALVVGNARYDTGLGALSNPVNDANLIARALRRAGFDVDLETNLDQKAMKRAIGRLGMRLAAAGPHATGLFYYGGHGLQVNNENYLVPIGADIEADTDADIEGVAASHVLHQMEAASNAVNIVILDACRNTPVLRKVRSTNRGLVRMDAPKGSFIAYSTAPGEVATDGNGTNSPFAQALSEGLQVAGVPIDQVFIGVRRKVLDATGQKQTPWTSSSLVNNFYFTGPVTVVAPHPAPTDPKAMELALWTSVAGSNDVVQLQSYLDQYPQGTFAAVARAKIKGLQKPVQTAAISPTLPPTTPSVVPAAVLGETLRVFRGHSHWVTSAFISPDGRKMLTASADGTARIWNVDDGKEERIFRHEYWLWSATWSADGRRIVTGSNDGVVRVWDAQTGRQQLSLRGHGADVWSAVMSPDGRLIASGSHDRTIRIWDAHTGEPLKALLGHTAAVVHVAFSPDGRFLVSASENGDNTARVWDVETGQNVLVLRGHSSGVRFAGFSPDGRQIVTTSNDNTARLWDANSGQCLTVLKGHDNQVLSAAFSPDGTRLATASDDNTTRLWDLASGRTLVVVKSRAQALSAGYAPDGASVVTASADGTARQWSAFGR